MNFEIYTYTFESISVFNNIMYEFLTSY